LPTSPPFSSISSPIVCISPGECRDRLVSIPHPPFLTLQVLGWKNEQTRIALIPSQQGCGKHPRKNERRRKNCTSSENCLPRARLLSAHHWVGKSPLFLLTASRVTHPHSAPSTMRRTKKKKKKSTAGRGKKRHRRGRKTFCNINLKVGRVASSQA